MDKGFIALNAKILIFVNIASELNEEIISMITGKRSKYYDFYTNYISHHFLDNQPIKPPPLTGFPSEPFEEVFFIILEVL